MLIILAGITLNAVIGENGIIFQAKDTKNLVDNETKYDNEQLASLQNELKDNQLYSGIGIIPGTDQGGSSEGGENGTSGNQGGQTNSGGNRINTQDPNSGGGTLVDGKTDEDPKILVTAGEEVAASFYQTDVTIQIYTKDRSKKIKYILSTDVTAITDQLYPSGLVKELDIENGGTLTFTKDGEYTITAYAYDTAGNKSNPTIMWFKKQSKGSTTTGGITVTIASGKIGLNEYYTSNVTLRVLGTDSGSSIVKYRVQGTATSGGQIGNLGRETGGVVDTKEQVIANGTTFKITMDGEFTIQAFSYDAGGNLINPSEVLRIKKDSARPVVRSFTGEQIVGTGFQVKIDAVDEGSGLVAAPYVYRDRLAETNGEFNSSEATAETTRLYKGLQQNKTYDIYATITDLAGNTTVTKSISKPALWVSQYTVAGNGNHNEGNRRYYGSDVTISARDQDSTNVEIDKSVVRVTGVVRDNENNGGDGNINGTVVRKGETVNLSYEISGSSIGNTTIAANGDWKVDLETFDTKGNILSINTLLVARDNIIPTITNLTKGDLTRHGQEFSVECTREGWSGTDHLMCTNSNGSITYGSGGYVTGRVTNGYCSFTILGVTCAGNRSNKLTSSDSYTTLASYNVGDSVRWGDWKYAPDQYIWNDGSLSSLDHYTRPNISVAEVSDERVTLMFHWSITSPDDNDKNTSLGTYLTTLGSIKVITSNDETLYFDRWTSAANFPSWTLDHWLSGSYVSGDYVWVRFWNYSLQESRGHRNVTKNVIFYTNVYNRPVVGGYVL